MLLYNTILMYLGQVLLNVVNEKSSISQCIYFFSIHFLREIFCNKKIKNGDGKYTTSFPIEMV